LARTLLCHLCANILKSIKKIIFSTEFIEKYRQSPTDFTRDRKLPFHLLICFLINFVKGAYQSELDRFFQAITRSPVAKRVVSKAALTKARMKLKPEAFVALNQCLMKEFDASFPVQTWLGFRLLAIDGTTLTLPKIKEIIDHFGVWKGNKGEPCPKARASQLFDPLNRMTLKAVVDPKSTGEREQARQLLSDIPVNSLILLDRGYPAFWLFKLIIAQGAQFCARISMNWKIVRQFAKSGRKEKIITLTVSPAGVRYCKELGLDLKPIKLRLIRVMLDTGESEILITSLMDKTLYPTEIFAALYHERWPVEEDYKIMKCRMEMEAFTGQSVRSIYQDFHANVFAKNLVAMLTFSVQQDLKSSGVKEKYPHQVNFSHAIGKAKHLVVMCFQRTKTTVVKLIQEFIKIVTLTTEPLRPGRKYPRNHKTTKKQHYQNYKPVLS
jgi:hypothetical protein